MLKCKIRLKDRRDNILDNQTIYLFGEAFDRRERKETERSNKKIFPHL